MKHFVNISATSQATSQATLRVATLRVATLRVAALLQVTAQLRVTTRQQVPT